MSNKRTNRAPRTARPKGEGDGGETRLRLGFPDTPTTRDVIPSPENDAKKASYIDLVALPGWKALLEDGGADAQFWTEADDWATERGCLAFRAISMLVPIEPAHTHAFLAGLMIGYERALSLPKRWLEEYAKLEKVMAAMRKGPPAPPDKREGLRIDPTAPRPPREPEAARGEA